ncbi:MAG: hypothetical protein CMP11_01375 [Zetaproteobacteria bacterium]|nr:hypothetical protein [Pseudobdellovibrionaceae bacterium]
MFVKIVITIILIFSSSRCFGRPIQGQQCRNFNFSVLEMMEDRSDRTIKKRNGYSLGVLFKPHDSFHMRFNLVFSPDNIKKPSSVDIKDDYYAFQSLIRFNKNFLFRFFVESGLSFIILEVQSSILNDNKIHYSNYYSWSNRIGFDYSINDSFEVAVFFGSDLSFLDYKILSLRGIGLNYNF